MYRDEPFDYSHVRDLPAYSRAVVRNWSHRYRNALRPRPYESSLSPASKRLRLSSSFFSLSTVPPSSSKKPRMSSDAAVSSTKVVLHSGRAPNRSRVSLPVIHRHWNFHHAASSNANDMNVFQFDGLAATSLVQLFDDVGTESATYPVAANSAPYQSIFVKSSTLDLTFKNDTNVILFLTLYSLVPKRDAVQSANTLYGNVFRQFLSTNTTGTGVGTPGLSPYDSRDVMNFYRIVKVQKIPMRPGQCHTHKIHYTINKRLNNSIVALDGDVAYFRDFYSGVLCFVTGSPVADSSGGATFSPTSMIVTGVLSTTIQYIEHSKPVYGITDSNSSTLPSTGNNDMNVTSGLADAFTQIVG